jgi:hypothetical protein
MNVRKNLMWIAELSCSGLYKPDTYSRVGLVEFGGRGKFRGHPVKNLTIKSEARAEGPKLWTLVTGLAQQNCEIASYFSGGGCRGLGFVDA